MSAHQRVCELVITAPDAEWAERITRDLIDRKLVACGHQFQIQSIYTWQGKTEANTETRVAFHTRVDLFHEISAIVTAAHPYEVPCVIALPIISASPSYAEWIINTTSSPSDSTRGAGGPSAGRLRRG